MANGAGLIYTADSLCGKINHRLSKAAAASSSIAHASVNLRGQVGDIEVCSLVCDAAIADLFNSAIQSYISASAPSLRNLSSSIARKPRNKSFSLSSVEAALKS